MSYFRRSVFHSLPILMMLSMLVPAMAQNAAKDLASAWADFNHYVLIARPDLAAASAQTLLESDQSQLLDVVEASDYRDDFGRTLERAGRTQGVQEAAAQLAKKIQDAKIARSRDAQRIAADIVRLAGGSRENLNATARLAAAGQFAAPQLLATLLDDRQSHLHPFVIKAIVSIGQSMIAPLSAALPQLPPRTMIQTAQALAEIGYPRALPALKQVLESGDTDPNARSAVQAAYTKLATAANIPADLSAAELHLRLGQNFYQTATVGGELPGYDPDQNVGITWEYKPDIGLIAIPVPGKVYGDVLAMRSAQEALNLAPDMEPALILWLASNLRRHNRLGGDADPSYPANLRQPAYYLRLAGPARQHAVLIRALDDGDVALAFEAISALAETAGAASLVSSTSGSQPLVRALYHADRRVRIRAALVLARARELSPFIGSDRVVRVLAEAIRPANIRYALAITPAHDDLNKLAATLRDQGFEVIAAPNLSSASPMLTAEIGLDVVFAQLSLDDLAILVRQTREDNRLAAVPLVAVIDPRDQTELNRRYEGTALKPQVAMIGDADSLKAAGQAALAKSSALSPQDTQQLTLSAISALRDLAMSKDVLFNPLDAQGSLIRCVADKAPEVVKASASVLAMLNTPQAQQALADAALHEAHPEDLRLTLLVDLASSARSFGNLLTGSQQEQIIALSASDQTALASAAARVAGALSLPPSHVVQSIAR